MFGTGYYVKVWKKENKGKYTDVQISSSKKNKDGVYETDFSTIARFIGHAHNKIDQVNLKDSIKLLECGVSNKYDKEKKITYTNYVVFDFETNGDTTNISVEDENTMPF